jgi:membrane-bound serine protease (ClpP class)
VLLVRIDMPITPVAADHLQDALGRAEADGFLALVIELDSPGGLDSSMRSMVQTILGADVPVVVYVSPPGARAASAGAIITLAAHVAAMAPGTAIGAATPVSLEGSDVERKVVNDAAAYAESLARLRDRDVAFAGDAVREARSVSASEAVAIGAVDLVAPSVAALLDDVDGRSVVVGEPGRTVVLHTRGATTVDYDLGLFRQIQQWLADPTLAYLFLSLGMLGLVYELATPGMGVPGVLGATFVVLGLFGLAVLPVNAVGVLFLALAAACFVAEVAAPGVGLGAAGGALMMVLGGIFLVDDAPGLAVSVPVILTVAAMASAAVLLAGRLALRARRAPPSTGASQLLDRTVTVSRRHDRCQAFLDGAWWQVRTRRGAVEDGSTARVVGLEGLQLVVEPEVSPPDTSQEAHP